MEEKRQFDVIKNETRIEDMDFNPVTMMLYWADSQERAIKRSYIPGTEEQPLAEIGHPQILQEYSDANVKPNALAFDWVTHNLYWAEIDDSSYRSKGSILVAKNDGRYKRSLISSNLEEPTSIAVDPRDGLMYWTDAGSNPKIEVAWMDGSKRRAIVTTNIQRPEALVIDFSMEHTIYWADSKLNFIESMDHDGRKRHTVLSGPNLKRPVSVDIFENLMYYVSQDDGALIQQDKFGRGVPVTVAKSLPNPKAIKIMHSKRYNSTIANPCSDELDECSHLCVLIPGGRSKCKCPSGQSFVNREHKICDSGKYFSKISRGPGELRRDRYNIFCTPCIIDPTDIVVRENESICIFVHFFIFFQPRLIPSLSPLSASVKTEASASTTRTVPVRRTSAAGIVRRKSCAFARQAAPRLPPSLSLCSSLLLSYSHRRDFTFIIERIKECK